MAGKRRRGQQIREFILDNIENNPKTIVPLTMDKFSVSRQAVHQHVRLLVSQGALIRVRSGYYELRPKEEWHTAISVIENPDEDFVWRNHIKSRLGHLPENVMDIWHYGFTEMFNNVVDHSESETADIRIIKTVHSTEMIIKDSGVGIFNKITKKMNLIDERHAVLELTKGKLTTDPERHTGEGIFFTSRMFDTFAILSGEVSLVHAYAGDEDWILHNQKPRAGTLIGMKLNDNTSRKTTEIFDRFTSEDNFGFTKTVVPVRLVQYGDEKLISRSQAKRLLARVDRFEAVILDFKEVETIGRAFADEVFRVFAHQHPDINLMSVNENDAVRQEIENARRQDLV
ncbi:MAG: DUF4325 domain-containing protein [Syntrophobacterales bacterium]|jgi:anti-sigma regulatory factor (Ser/Thr protein kinase)|nr:DUF4325 domain-containing protein [Syntrophobacterales bacterium]